MAESKFQPVMLIVERRVECHGCGALAIIVSLDWIENEGDPETIKAWCQPCFTKLSEEKEPV